MNPLVSFVVPIYNVEKHLQECVESILQQTNPNFEVILVDDGSPDHCPELCDRFAASDSRVSVIHKENAGVSVARNCGVNAAKGDWICFVDGDDWINERYVELIDESRDPNLDAVIFSEEEVENKQQANLRIVKTQPVILASKEIDEILKNVLNRYYVGTPDLRAHRMTRVCGKAYRRSLLQTPKIQFPQGIVSGEDTYFNLRFFSEAKQVMVRNDVIYGYRKNTESVTHRYNPELKNNFVCVVDMIGKFVRTAKPELEDSFMLYCVSAFLFVSMLDFCHPQNPKSLSVRRQEFLDLRNDSTFEYPFRQAALEQFPATKRLACLLLKNRCFLCFCILNKIQIHL